MSRTTAHRPWRMVRDEADYTRREWRWHVSAAYGRSTVRQARRRFWGSVRRMERDALAKGQTPEPTRTRHTVLWDLS